MTKKLLLATLCICVTLASLASAQAMPMRIMADGAYPMDCKPLPDGGFLLCGLRGEQMADSIESYLYSEGVTDEQALAQARPLSGYVAAYDTDGTQRWLYRLPERAPYQAIFAQPLADGTVLCRAMQYTRHPVNYIDWDTTADAFLLDENGQYLRQLPWLTALSNQGPRSFLIQWVHLLPDGILAIEPIQDFDAPYTPTLTMYNVDGHAKWQVSHEALEGYASLAFSQAEDGYISYGIHRSTDGTLSGDPLETCLYKLDKQGRLLWQRKKFDPEFPGKLAVLRDGSLIGSATRYVPEQATDIPILYGYDSQGNTRWRADDSAHGLTYINRIFQAADGRLYLSGWMQTDAAEPFNVIAAITPEGVSMDYTQLFGKAGRRTFSDILIESGDGLFIVGTMAPKDGSDRWFILRLDGAI